MNEESHIRTVAREIAARHGIPLPIVLGVIQVESAFNTYATRFEAPYRWCMNVKSHQPFTAERSVAGASTAPYGFPGTTVSQHGYYSSDNTEWIHQKTSWGAMQAMGAVAREHGFNGPLPQLCEPEIGIEYGCRHLARLHDRFGARHGWAGTLDAFNDGNAKIERARDYPHKVAETSPEALALIFPNGI